MEDNKNKSAFVDDKSLYNKSTKPTVAPEPNIGIDTNSEFYSNLVEAGDSGVLDINSLNNFTNVSQSRDQIYSLLDTMSEDPTIAAVLETYAEDATEANDSGSIVWAESQDADISKYINYLLDVMCVQKNIYKWTFCLCKFGDVYLRLYRESDGDDSFIFKNRKEKESLNEDVKLKAYRDNDRYSYYVEMVPNPAEVFELTKMGKTYAYIKTNVNSYNTQHQNKMSDAYNNAFQYKFKVDDIDVYEATEFVHASLEDNTTRTPEKVKIFQVDEGQDYDSSKVESSSTFTVRRGQSLLYNVFKVWRELNLLENSILLNRLTKSSILRVIGVEVGDMPKEMVGNHLRGIKNLIENKTAFNTGNSMSEYTNPGPIENNVYIPIRGEIGTITTQQIGGDVNVGQLTDLDYFTNLMFGALRVPKQYFGFTDDGAGFNGGESLTIISSRYSKMIKRIQSTIIQMITDSINLILVDSGLNSYVNKFTIKMQSPTTREEIERREGVAGKIQLVSDVMNMVAEIENTSTKLRILKSLLSNVITDSEVISIIQEEIDKLTSEEESGVAEQTTSEGEMPLDTSSSGGFDIDSALGLGGEDVEETGIESENEVEEAGDEDILPTPGELNIGDLTDNNNENI